MFSEEQQGRQCSYAPVCVKIGEIRRGESEPLQHSTLRAGDQPIKADTTGVGEERMRNPQTQMKNIVPSYEAGRPTAVVFRGRPWQTRQKIRFSVGAVLVVLKCV